MSLYNQIFGYNEYTPVLLGILGLESSAFGRYRDISAKLDEEGNIYIVVLTRCGGGNRDEYQETIDKLKKHDWYFKDYDESFDSTYACIEFKVDLNTVRDDLRDKVGEVLVKIAERNDPRGASQKFQDLTAKMNDPKQADHPDVKRSMEVGKKIVEQVEESARSGDRGPKIIEV